jgi:phosphate-selective porin OprO/OprP
MRMQTALLTAAAVASLTVLGAGAAQAQDSIAWKGAPQFVNDDANFKVRGRILLDGIFQNVDRDGVGSTDINVRQFRARQLFLGVEGQLNSKFAYKLEGGAVSGGAWAWDDAVIEFKPNDFTSIMVGNVKAFSMENMTSTRFRSFMEQGALGDITGANYNLGVVAKTWGQNWTIAGAIQGDSINAADTAAAPGGVADINEQLSFIARGTYAPILTDHDKLHLGLWVRQRDHGTEGGFNYRTSGNVNGAVGGRYVASGAFGDQDTTIAAEVMYIHDSFSVQAEYADLNVTKLATISAANGSDGHVKTGYAFVSWFPTGDSRNYDVAKGEMGRPKIKNPITAGGWGGVELLARVDYADLKELRGTSVTAPSAAGDFVAYTVGVNYFPTSYVKFTADYTHAKNDNTIAGNAASVFNTYDVDTFQFRTQIDF